MHKSPNPKIKGPDNTGWLEIDPKIADAASIEKRIQAKLSQRDPSNLPHTLPVELVYQLRAEMLGDPDAATLLDQLEDLNIEPDLLQHVQQANESNTTFDTSMVVADSAAERVPILGQLWYRFRKSAHELVLFYTNSATRQQIDVNVEMLNAINRLTILVHEQQEYIDALHKQLDARSSPTSTR